MLRGKHALVLDRGDELHVLEGMPPQCAASGAVTDVRSVLTEFGPVWLELAVSPDGLALKRVGFPRLGRVVTL